MSMKNHVPYMAYVLRLWRNGDTTPWRAALECARTGERHAFATLADLVAFLEAETQEEAEMGNGESNDQWQLITKN